MIRRVWAGLALAGLAGGAAHAAEPSLCAQLAAEARRLPPAAWSAPEPLAKSLHVYRTDRPRELSAAEQALVDDPRFRERIAAAPGDPVEVDALPGTPVVLLSHVAGTANCQMPLLVEAAPGRAARVLAPPFPLNPQSLCVTQQAAVARVMGRPAFVVGGATAMVGDEHRYRMAPWTPKGWGASCSITWRLRREMTAGPRFCGADTRLCEAGQPVAQRLAQAYEAARASGKPTLDAAAFAGGQVPSAAIVAALNPPLAEAGAIGNLNPPFPLFGADEQRLDPMATQFSNADPRRLPVFVNGRWWLAVVGRGGVGWREGDAVLVAMFAPPGRTADAVASYQFRVAPVGLKDVVVRDGRP